MGVDDDLFFTYVDSSWAGATHDTKVLYATDLYQHWEIEKWRPYPNCFLAADSGYPPSLDWIITPFEEIAVPTTEVAKRRMAFNRDFCGLRIAGGIA